MAKKDGLRADHNSPILFFPPLKNMPHDPKVVLTMKEVSLIGMKAISETSRKTLRYHTGIDQTAEVGVVDLIAVMRPYVHTRTATKKRGLGSAPKKVQRLSQYDKGKAAIYDFIGHFFAEIRDIICKNKTSNKSLGITTGTLTTLSTWVAASFRAPSHFAKSVASGVLVVVMTAARGAFCKMNQAQAAKIFPKPRPAKKTKKKKE